MLTQLQETWAVQGHGWAILDGLLDLTVIVVLILLLLPGLFMLLLPVWQAIRRRLG